MFLGVNVPVQAERSVVERTCRLLVLSLLIQLAQTRKPGKKTSLVTDIYTSLTILLNFFRIITRNMISVSNINSCMGITWVHLMTVTMAKVSCAVPPHTNRWLHLHHTISPSRGGPLGPSVNGKGRQIGETMTHPRGESLTRYSTLHAPKMI